MIRFWKIFLGMPHKEKILVTLLAGLFAISLIQFILSQVRFPIRGEKDIFVEGMVGHIAILNPLFVDFNDTDRDISQLIFSGLIRYDPVKKNFFSDLAAHWEKSQDGLNYSFTLHPQALWHDKTPVTADDIVFTFQDIIQDPGFRNTLLKKAFEGVKIAKNGTSTVTFTLPKRNSYFISHLTVGILPKHLLEETPIANLEKSNFSQHPVGTGPYRVTALKLDKTGDQIDILAFPEYYGPKPLIPRMRFLTFSNEESLLKDISALHAVGKILSSSTVTKGLASDPRFALFPYTLNQFTALYFNTEHPLLREKRFRQSLALGLTKKELVGKGEQRVDALDFQDHSAQPPFVSNTEAAAKILDQLGLKIGQEGFRKNSKGDTVSLTLVASTKIHIEIVERIRNQWQTLGIQIKKENVDEENFLSLVQQRRYDILLTRQNLGYNRDVYPLFHSSQRGGEEGNPSGLNFSNFKSFRTDGITEAIRKEKNPADKEKLLLELSRVLQEEGPVIFLSTPVYVYALDKRTQAFPTNTLDFHSDRLRLLTYLTFLTNYP